MLASVLSQLHGIVNAILSAMSGIVVLWPVAVMVGFMILGAGIAFVTKLAGGRKGKRRRK